MMLVRPKSYGAAGAVLAFALPLFVLPCGLMAQGETTAAIAGAISDAGRRPHSRSQRYDQKRR